MPVSFQYALIVCIVTHIWRKPHPCMLWYMFLPSTFHCPPLRCNCPMIPIKNHKRALCVTSNDNQKRFVVRRASAIYIALLQNLVKNTRCCVQLAVEERTGDTGSTGLLSPIHMHQMDCQCSPPRCRR